MGRGQEGRGEDFVRLVSKRPCYGISDWLPLGFEFSCASTQPMEDMTQFCRTTSSVLLGPQASFLMRGGMGITVREEKLVYSFVERI